MADIYTYDQLASWYSQHGGAERGRREYDVSVPNPASARNGGTDATAPATLKEHRVVITAQDGSTVTLTSQGMADPADPTSESWIVDAHIDAKGTGPGKT